MIPTRRPSDILLFPEDFDFDFFPLAETPTAWETVRRKAKDAQTEGFMSERSGQRVRRGIFQFCQFIWLVIDVVGLVGTESIRYFDKLYVLEYSWAVRSAVIALTLTVMSALDRPTLEVKRKRTGCGSGQELTFTFLKT
jgi:hypothetical protein